MPDSKLWTVVDPKTGKRFATEKDSVPLVFTSENRAGDEITRAQDLYEGGERPHLEREILRRLKVVPVTAQMLRSTPRMSSP